MIPAPAHATDDVILVRDGKVLEGGLLVVRDTALLIDEGGHKMWEKKPHPNVVVIPFDSIVRVEVKGRLVSMV